MIENTTPIRVEWFYYIEGNKSKLNWFLFEFALGHYDAINSSPEFEDYRRQYGERHIAQYCSYFARRIKESILNELRGRTKRVIFYERYISDFYPHHDSELDFAMNRIAMESFEALQTKCDDCPQRCLYDYMAISAYFDEHRD